MSHIPRYSKPRIMPVNLSEFWSLLGTTRSRLEVKEAGDPAGAGVRIIGSVGGAAVV
jgi:hypothetical protein